MLKNSLIITFEAICTLLNSLPRYFWLSAIKKLPYQLLGAKFGKRTTMYPGVWISPGINLVVGDDVDLARGVLISTKGGVTIGDRVLIGYDTKIISSNHVIPPGEERIFGSGHSYAPVSIEDDVWIGTNCVILPGVTIGEGAVIAAGSIVTKNVESFSIVGGTPAKTIKKRSS